MITQSNTIEIDTNEGKLAYLAARVKELIPEHPLLSKITVALDEYPGATAGLFSDGDAFFEVNIPPGMFDDLALLDMILAHELGHVAQIREPNVFHRFAARYHDKYAKLSKAAMYLSLFSDQLGSKGAKREAEADVFAVRALQRQGYKAEDYYRVLDWVVADIAGIKKRRFRWPRLVSTRRRTALVRRFIRQVNSSRL